MQNKKQTAWKKNRKFSEIHGGRERLRLKDNIFMRAHTLKPPGINDEIPFFIVDNPSRDFYHPLTIDEIKNVLSKFCKEDISSITHIWLRKVKKKEYDFIIMDKNDESFIGICGFNNINAEIRLANLGYWIRTGRKGQGIASTVVPMLAKFGFNNLKLHRLEIVVAEDNLPSQRVAEKAGALREGLLRNRLTVHGKILDAFMFSLVPDDFK